MVARYDMSDGQFITLRHRDGKVHITAANMMVETNADFIKVTEVMVKFEEGRAYSRTGNNER